MPVGSWLGHDLFLLGALKLRLCAVSICVMGSALSQTLLALYIVQAGCLLGVWLMASVGTSGPFLGSTAPAHGLVALSCEELD